MTDRKDLPRGVRGRLGHLGRVAGAGLRFGVRRALGPRDADAAQFGEALLGELDQLKGMAMKVGQILSYMDGVLPPGSQEAMARLQVGVQPMAWEVIRAELERGLGGALESLFDEVDPRAIAAASIGQVHRGRYRGADVAIKVQYPGIAETFDADMKHLHRMGLVAGLASSVDGGAIVDDLHARLLEECDYAHEAAWQGVFREAFAGVPGIVIPEIVSERTCPTVLTSAWCEGSTLDAFVREASAASRQRAATSLVRFAWQSLFGLGTMHADPHPGNQLFREEGIVFLDFGCVRTFPDAWLEATRRELRAVLEGDRVAFRAAVLELGMVPRPDRFDFDEHWAMQRFVWGPYCEAHYRFAPGSLAGIARFSGPTAPNMRWMAIPPPWIWLQRVVWGLHSVLARLEAEGDFRSILLAALEGPLVRPVAPPVGRVRDGA